MGNKMALPLSRGRRIALGIVGALIVFLMASPPESGVAFFFSAWSSDVDGGAHKLHFLMRGVGSLVTVFAGLVLIVKPAWALGAVQKFVATGAAFLIAGIVSLHVWPPVIVYPVMAIITTAVMFWVFRGRLPWQQPKSERPLVSKPMLALTAVIAVPLIVWGLGEASLQRSSETLHGDLGHWGSGLANAMMIILLMLFASRRMPGWQVPAWGAGFTLLMLGVASMYWPNQASSIGVGWGVLAIIASVTFVALAEYENRTTTAPARSPAEQPATT
jgi:hypothetical protein